MADVLTPEQRRLNMSRIKGRNTKPERTLRSALHAAGLRFRVHRRDLPGCPDIVFSKARIVVFVDGCFWHGCPIHSVSPRTNSQFWSAKIEKNIARDKVITQALKDLGWDVIRVWEHDVKANKSELVRRIADAVRTCLPAKRGGKAAPHT